VDIFLFGKSHQTLVVFADSPERLVKDTNIVTSTLEDLGLIVIYSTLSLAQLILLNYQEIIRFALV
ncbi:hypothetical protein NO375_23705, partial [Escherichia coli]|nr:hypothetical protein [Escherichia coli]